MKIIKKTGDVYVFLDEVKQDLTFSFTDSKSLPRQTIELQYYADNPIPWAAEYSSTKKLQAIHNIQKWAWEHQKDINNRIREMNKVA
jgi:hypothetical protein